MAHPDQHPTEFSGNNLSVPGSNVQVHYGNTYYSSTKVRKLKTSISRWLFGSEAVFSQRILQSSLQRILTEPRTGRWFLDGTEFSRWGSRPHSFLWLYGKTGCGKTMLCSSVISLLQSTCLNIPKEASIYHFFTVTDQRSQTCDTIVRSLVYQLANHSKSTRTHMEQLYSTLSENGLAADYAQLVGILKELSKSLKAVYLIIDSLDECIEQHEVCQFLETLWAEQIPAIRILVSSNTTQSRATELSLMRLRTEEVHVTSKVVYHDIETYIRSLNLEQWDDEQQNQIISHITAGADGSFRWAAGQLSAIQSCDTEEELETSLASLPKSLTETYERILSSIRSPSSIEKLKILLCWLLHAARPLRIEELRETVAFSWQGQSYYDPKKRLNQRPTIIDKCTFLVAVDDDLDEPHIFAFDHDYDNISDKGASPKGFKSKSTWCQKSVLRLAHSSVVQFLQEDPLNLLPHTRNFLSTREEAHELLAHSALACILHQNSLIQASSSGEHRLLLFDYATVYWYHHTQEAGSSKTGRLPTLIQKALDTDWEVYRLITYPNPSTVYDPWSSPQTLEPDDGNELNSEDDLCNGCQKIRYSEIEGPLGLRHGTYESLVESAQTCRVCKMIRHSLLQFGVARYCQQHTPSFLSEHDAECLRGVVDSNIRRFAGCKEVWLCCETNDPFLRVSCYCYLGRLHLFTNPESPISKHVSGRAVHSSLKDPDLEMYGRWYQECEQDHSRCLEEAPLPLLPSKILEIGLASLTLLKNDRKTDRGRYATLTFCWDRTSAGPGRLTPQNLKWETRITFGHSIHYGLSAKTEIIESSLSDELRDVIRLARFLKIRYLWIDRLCFDYSMMRNWMHRKTKHQDIQNYYETATLNIVSGVENPTDSLFLHRTSPLFPPTCVNKSEQLFLGWLGTDFYCDPRGVNVEKYPDSWKYESLPHLQAYTMQGIRLAHRNLVVQADQQATSTALAPVQKHILTSQLYMQCKEEIRWENGRRRAAAAQDMSNWYQLVEEYSTRRLSEESDRLAGISVIAQKYAQHCCLPKDAVYLAGLWADQLPRNLLWRVVKQVWDEGKWSHLLGTKPPTWSWAHSGGQVKYEWPPDATVCAEVLGWGVKPQTKDPFLDVQFAWILIRSFLVKFEVADGKLTHHANDTTANVRAEDEVLVTVRMRCFMDRFWDGLHCRVLHAFKVTRRVALLVKGRETGPENEMIRVGLMIVSKPDTPTWELLGVETEVKLV